MIHQVSALWPDDTELAISNEHFTTAVEVDEELARLASLPGPPVFAWKGNAKLPGFLHTLFKVQARVNVDFDGSVGVGGLEHFLWHLRNVLQRERLHGYECTTGYALGQPVSDHAYWGNILIQLSGIEWDNPAFKDMMVFVRGRVLEPSKPLPQDVIKAVEDLRDMREALQNPLEKEHLQNILSPFPVTKSPNRKDASIPCELDLAISTFATESLHSYLVNMTYERLELFKRVYYPDR